MTCNVKQIGHQIFVAGGDVDVARLERGEPVGVDLGEHAGGGAELQQRDVFALGDRARGLRLDLDDLGIGEPADQVDVVHGEIDDDADIRHARRERPDPGDGDRQNILALDRALDRLDRRIEALDMAGHQGDAGAPRGGDDLAALLDGGGDRLLDQDMDAARGAVDGDVAMQVGRRRDGDGIDAALDQAVEVGEGLALEVAGDVLARLAVGIDDADQLDAGQFRQHPRMVRAHHADADHADPQCAVRACLCRLTHERSPIDPDAPPSPSTDRANWRPEPARNPNTFGFNSLQRQRHPLHREVTAGRLSSI